MTEQPDREELARLLGPELYKVWTGLCAAIEDKYDMETLWGRGGKKWQYEYKFRRGGKTLCTLYAQEGRIGLLVIFGKAEREKFEASRETFPTLIQSAYDGAQTYHDGKWAMFEPEGLELLADFVRLLAIKRRPNRK